MADPSLIECFENPAAGRDYSIRHETDEFTSLCPKTGHPDFATVVLTYCPDAACVELKSLKLYYQAYRNEGIFYEAVTNKIRDDLAAAIRPKWLIVQTRWKGRGGIRSSIIAVHGPAPDAIAESARHKVT